jgi:hypothetical protein
VWSQLRREWARAHGFDEDDMESVGLQPWDESAI